MQKLVKAYIVSPEERVKKIMREMNVSRQELSSTLGISLSSVAMYFSGCHKIRRVVALAIQASYGINAEWIMYNKPPVFLKQADEQGRKYSKEAIEIARLCNTLSKKDQVIMKKIAQGFSFLPTEIS